MSAIWQLKDHEFFKHLALVSKIRKTHDAIYQKAFDRETRKELELMQPKSKFGTPRASEARQRSRNGDRCLEEHREPTSKMISSLRHCFTEDFLVALDTAISSLGTAAGVEKVQEAVETFNLQELEMFKLDQQKLAFKLGLLLLKKRAEDRSLTASKLWRTIERKTDGMFHAVEDVWLEGTFQDTLHALFQDTWGEFDAKSLTIGGLKDPVRAFIPI